jgi:hypothetical protein
MAHTSINGMQARRMATYGRTVGVVMLVCAASLWALQIPGMHELPAKPQVDVTTPPPAVEPTGTTPAAKVDSDGVLAMSERLNLAVVHAAKPIAPETPIDPPTPPEEGPVWEFLGPIFDGARALAIVSVDGTQKILAEGRSFGSTKLLHVADDKIEVQVDKAPKSKFIARKDRDPSQSVSWMRNMQNNGPARRGSTCRRAGQPAARGPGPARRAWDHTPADGAVASDPRRRPRREPGPRRQQQRRREREHVHRRGEHAAPASFADRRGRWGRRVGRHVGPAEEAELSGRVCYVARDARTGGAESVRLVAPGSDETWQRPSTPADSGAVLSQTGEAADWVAQHAAEGDGPRDEIAVLCVDVEGATCDWLTAPTSEESVVLAAIAQGAAEWNGESAGSAGGVWAPPSTSEASVQALAAPPEARSKSAGRKGPQRTPAKMAVASLPDVDARLFMDALDERGVAVDRAVSLWHGLAMAWDPGAQRRAVAQSEQVVEAASPVSAVVLIDPAGRLLWSWSRGGELIAAGTIRLLREKRDGAPPVLLTAQDVARLSSDWLSWSVQLGAAPVRVVCVGPRLSGESDAAEALSPAAMGEAITASWPGATVDLAVHEDPIGATLKRLAGASLGESAADARRQMLALTQRPGRAHRSLYRWTALCVLAGAGLCAAVAWQAFSAAGRARAAGDQARTEAATKVTQLAPPTNEMQRDLMASAPGEYLAGQIQSKRSAMNPSSGLPPAEPIMTELETLSYVLGVQGIEIDEITLASSTGAMVYVSVPDTATGEFLRSSLEEIGTSHINWRTQFNSGPGSRPGKQSVTFMGMWKNAGARP